jgi:hypothetical protein
VSLVATRVFIESRLLMGIPLACSSQSRTLGSNGHAAEEVVSHVCSRLFLSPIVVLVLFILTCRCIR